MLKMELLSETIIMGPMT